MRIRSIAREMDGVKPAVQTGIILIVDPTPDQKIMPIHRLGIIRRSHGGHDHDRLPLDFALGAVDLKRGVAIIVDGQRGNVPSLERDGTTFCF